MELMQPKYLGDLTNLEQRVNRLGNLPEKLKLLLHGRNKKNGNSILKVPDDETAFLI